MSRFPDAIKETVSTEGTVLTIALIGAQGGYIAMGSPSDVVDGSILPYTIRDGLNLEIGEGTWNTGGTFDRTTVYSKLEGGVYTENPGIRLSLSGSATISVIANSELLVNIKSGRKNIIINGDLVINQREAATNTTTTNGYNYDRWFYDGTYLYYGVEEGDVRAAEHVLNWNSDATCEYQLVTTATFTTTPLPAAGWTSIAKDTPFTLSGIVGKNLWLKFAAGTDGLNLLDKVQLELGSVATDLEYLHYSVELAKCQRYYSFYSCPTGLNFSAYVDNSIETWSVSSPVVMRAVPDVTLITAGWTFSACDSAGLGLPTESSARLLLSSIGASANCTVSNIAYGDLIAEAEL